MALANQLGLSNKMVSERHYFASKINYTAGQAAKILTRAVNKKLSAKDVKLLFKLKFGYDMEWHHSGFYQSTTGQTMGRTYFISPDKTNRLIEEFDTLLPLLEKQKKCAEEYVYAFYWIWDNSGRRRTSRWNKVLKTYEGKRSELPKNATECEREVYETAKKAEGRVYTGWDVPDISEFYDEANRHEQTSKTI